MFDLVFTLTPHRSAISWSVICLAVPCIEGIKGSCAKNAEVEIACGGGMETPESSHTVIELRVGTLKIT